MSSEPFLGEILMFAGTFAPRGFLKCEGQLLPISQNSALFSILGTTYGGDGRTTFALPDLRGRVPINDGAGPGLSHRRLGQSGGHEQVTLSVNQLPAHSHPAHGSSAQGNTSSPEGAVPATLSESRNLYNNATIDETMSNEMIGSTGNGQPIDTMPPYLAITFIIAVTGVFPSRS